MLSKKLTIINSQEYFLNENIIMDIQEKININNQLLEELLVQA
jgi:hypothetical protein